MGEPGIRQWQVQTGWLSGLRYVLLLGDRTHSFVTRMPSSDVGSGGVACFRCALLLGGVGTWARWDLALASLARLRLNRNKRKQNATYLVAVYLLSRVWGVPCVMLRNAVPRGYCAASSRKAGKATLRRSKK